MSALISGYEYDIFVSYRQKDNKYDGWVTEFVANLRKEIEATFKEDVSIYFDQNPHDGLGETHDVDESLKEKLRCLIFIPIVSQTYCDPNSFAWKNEFLVFKKLAAEDQFGFKIKLGSGNVSSRILPVRIHDLDAEDKALLENELGPIRAIDFIFKSSGVNRPLRSNEDHPNDNHNKTYYRDQVNKVANTIKDIASSMKAPEKRSTSFPDRQNSIIPRRKRKWILAAAVAALSLVTAYYFLDSSNDTPFQPNEKTIAILAFRNLTGDPGQEHFSDGISDEIASKLSTVAELEVTPLVRSIGYKKKDFDISDVARQLNVKYILDGSVRREKDSVRISVSLIDMVGELQKWTDTYTYTGENIFKIQSAIALRVIRALEVELALEKKNEIEELPTQSKEAYELFLKGREHQNKNTPKDVQLATHYYYKAVEVDPNFTVAKRNIAQNYLLRVGRDYLGEQWADSALNIMNQLIAKEPRLWTNYLTKGWAFEQKGMVDSVYATYQTAALNAPSAGAMRRVNAALSEVHVEQGKLEEAFHLRLPQWRNEKNVFEYLGMARMLAQLDEVDLARKFILSAAEMDPGNSSIQLELINLTALEGKVPQALRMLDSVRKIHTDFLPFTGALGYAELLRKNYKQSEGHYLKFLESYPDAPHDVLPPRTHLGKIYKEFAQNETQDFIGAAEKSEFYLKESYRRDSIRLKKGDQTSTIPYSFALINFVRGNRKDGYFWLNKAIEKGFLNYRLMLIEPIFEKYRQDEEFKTIVANLKGRLEGARKNIEKHFGMTVNQIPGISDATYQKQMFIGMGIFRNDGSLPLITRIYKNSPAEEAGLKAGDKIISFTKGENDEFIEFSPAGISSLSKYMHDEGKVARIKVRRDGQKELLIVTITSRLLQTDP